MPRDAISAGEATTTRFSSTNFNCNNDTDDSSSYAKYSHSYRFRLGSPFAYMVAFAVFVSSPRYHSCRSRCLGIYPYLWDCVLSDFYLSVNLFFILCQFYLFADHPRLRQESSPLVMPLPKHKAPSQNTPYPEP